MRTYVLIATDSRSEYARGKLKRHPLTVCLRMKLSLKYRLQADSVRSASDRTEAVFLSSVTRLHCYVCLASACLARVFVLMWMQLYRSESVQVDRLMIYFGILALFLPEGPRHDDPKTRRTGFKEPYWRIRNSKAKRKLLRP